MLNSSDILRGYTDTIILAQLDQGDNYGYVISKNVQEITRGELELKEATLYTTFRRQENRLPGGIRICCRTGGIAAGKGERPCGN